MKLWRLSYGSFRRKDTGSSEIACRSSVCVGAGCCGEVCVVAVGADEPPPPPQPASRTAAHNAKNCARACNRMSGVFFICRWCERGKPRDKCNHTSRRAKNRRIFARIFRADSPIFWRFSADFPPKTARFPPPVCDAAVVAGVAVKAETGAQRVRRHRGGILHQAPTAGAP